MTVPAKMREQIRRNPFEDYYQLADMVVGLADADEEELVRHAAKQAKDMLAELKMSQEHLNYLHENNLASGANLNEILEQFDELNSSTREIITKLGGICAKKCRDEFVTSIKDFQDRATAASREKLAKARKKYSRFWSAVDKLGVAEKSVVEQPLAAKREGLNARIDRRLSEIELLKERRRKSPLQFQPDMENLLTDYLVAIFTSLYIVSKLILLKASCDYDLEMMVLLQKVKITDNIFGDFALPLSASVEQLQIALAHVNEEIISDDTVRNNLKEIIGEAFGDYIEDMIILRRHSKSLLSKRINLLMEIQEKSTENKGYANYVKEKFAVEFGRMLVSSYEYRSDLDDSANLSRLAEKYNIDEEQGTDTFYVELTKAYNKMASGFMNEKVLTERDPAWHDTKISQEGSSTASTSSHISVVAEKGVGGTRQADSDSAEVAAVAKVEGLSLQNN